MRRKKPTTKAGKQAKMGKVMGEFSAGKLRSGSKGGPRVKSRKQAIAIGLSESGQSNRGAGTRRRRNPAADMSVENFEKKYGGRPL